MNRFVLSLIFLLPGFFATAQDSLSRRVSEADSILLQQFWTNLSDAVMTRDRNKLLSLCSFPFFCSPCVDYLPLKRNEVPPPTVKVTANSFFKSDFNILLSDALVKKLSTDKTFSTDIFYPTPVGYGKTKMGGFEFSYIRNPNSKRESPAVFIFLEKIKGAYKITGIDTVP